MYPRGTPHAHYPKLRGGTILISPHLPFTLTGLLLMAAPTVSSHGCVHSRLTVGVKRHRAYSHVEFTAA